MYLIDKPGIKISKPKFELFFWIILFLLIISVILELITQSPWISTIIPFPSPIFNSTFPELDVKFQRLGRVKEIDCMFFGSSMIDADLNPILFEKIIDENLDQDFTCFNMGFSGAMVETSGAVATTLLEKYPLKLVVIGISPIEMDKNYFITRPIAKMPFFDFFNGNPTLLGWLFHHTNLPWYLSGLSVLRNEVYQADLSYYDVRLNERGARISETIGEIVHGEQKIRLQNFSINSVDMDALDSTITKLQNKGVRVVAIEMPVNSAHFPYLIQGGSAAYQAKFLNPVEELLKLKGVPFIRSQEITADLLPDPYWANRNHLNYSGAVVFTTYLTNKMISDGVFR